MTIHQILEGVHAKNLEATILFVHFTKAFDSIHRGKIELILLAYGLPKKNVATIMMLYRNTKVKVYHPLTPSPRSQRWSYQLWYLFATTLSASLQSLCYNAGKNRSKVPSRESDHAQPCPTLWFFKSKADGPVWKEEGSLVAEDWTPKGYMYCRTQKKIIIIITPISVVDKKRVYKTSKLQMATKICGCDV